MRGKEAATMLPEQGPDLVAVGPGQRQTGQLVCRKKLEAPFAVRRRQEVESGSNFEEEHQPVGLPLVTVLADQPGQMQVGGLEGQTKFFRGFATGAGVRRFAQVGPEFSAARTPQAAVRFLRPLQQEDFVLFIETVEQRADLVRQRHPLSETGMAPLRKTSPGAREAWGSAISNQ